MYAGVLWLLCATGACEFPWCRCHTLTAMATIYTIAAETPRSANTSGTEMDSNTSAPNTALTWRKVFCVQGRFWWNISASSVVGQQWAAACASHNSIVCSTGTSHCVRCRGKPQHCVRRRVKARTTSTSSAKQSTPMTVKATAINMHMICCLHCRVHSAHVCMHLGKMGAVVGSCTQTLLCLALDCNYAGYVLLASLVGDQAKVFMWREREGWPNNSRSRNQGWHDLPHNAGYAAAGWCTFAATGGIARGSKAWSRPNWWSSKGRQGGNQQTKSDIEDTDVTHNTPFEPHMVYRMILPVSSANMGTTWWKERIEQAGKFGVKMTWRVVPRSPDFNDISPLYVAPSA